MENLLHQKRNTNLTEKIIMINIKYKDDNIYEQELLTSYEEIGKLRYQKKLIKKLLATGLRLVDISFY